MDPDARLAAFAQLAVRVGAGLQAGQELLLDGQLEHAPLPRAMAEEAYRAGAPYVDVRYADPWVRRALVAGGPEDSLSFTPPWLTQRLERAIEVGAAVIAVAGGSNAAVYEGLDHGRLLRSRHPAADKVWIDAVMKRRIAGAIVACPRPGGGRGGFGGPDTQPPWEGGAPPPPA